MLRSAEKLSDVKEQWVLPFLFRNSSQLLNSLRATWCRNPSGIVFFLQSTGSSGTYDVKILYMGRGCKSEISGQTQGTFIFLPLIFKASILFQDYVQFSCTPGSVCQTYLCTVAFAEGLVEFQIKTSDVRDESGGH